MGKIKQNSTKTTQQRNIPYTPFLNSNVTPMQAAMRQLQADYADPEKYAAYWNATHPQTANETPIVAQSDGTFRKETRNIPLKDASMPSKTALEFTPVVGDIMFAGDVADEARRGNYGTAAAIAGLAVGLPVVGKKAGKAVSKFIRKFRGKDIDFSKWTDKQWDDAYNSAVKSGNIEEAQMLRDVHFMVKAPNTTIVEKGSPIHAYHGTGKLFNEFDTTGKYSTLDEGYYGVGAYFAPNKELANIYATGEKTPIVYNTYLNITNPLRHIRDENADLLGKVITENDGVISKIPDDLVDPTFDMTEYVATKPNQIKSANAITYDDAGNIIPLSKRDNFNINDMRYIWPTAILGGTTAASYANQQVLNKKSGGRLISNNIIQKFKNRNK